MSHAQILLSTYNGTRYLPALLESLIEQDHQDFSILVRDDGSTDATVDLLGGYQGRAPLQVTAAPHVGATRSFLVLLSQATAEHVAFCDQDDIWLPDKLRTASAWLDRQPVDVPALYCGRTVIVDAVLTPIMLSTTPRRSLCFENALVENVASGCTVVMNRAARTLIVKKLPAFALAHDCWSYLVVAAFGRIGYDSDPKVLYRQHAGNAVGAATGVSSRWRRRIRPFIKNRRELPLVNQAREFARLFAGDLDPAKSRLLGRFLDRRQDWRASLAYAARPDVFRQSRTDDLFLRVLLGLGLT